MKLFCCKNIMSHYRSNMKRSQLWQIDETSQQQSMRSREKGIESPIYYDSSSSSSFRMEQSVALKSCHAHINSPSHSQSLLENISEINKSHNRQIRKDPVHSFKNIHQNSKDKRKIEQKIKIGKQQKVEQKNILERQRQKTISKVIKYETNIRNLSKVIRKIEIQLEKEQQKQSISGSKIEQQLKQRLQRYSLLKEFNEKKLQMQNQLLQFLKQMNQKKNHEINIKPSRSLSKKQLMEQQINRILQDKKSKYTFSQLYCQDVNDVASKYSSENKQNNIELRQLIFRCQFVAKNKLAQYFSKAAILAGTSRNSFKKYAGKYAELIKQNKKNKGNKGKNQQMKE